MPHRTVSGRFPVANSSPATDDTGISVPRYRRATSCSPTQGPTAVVRAVRGIGEFPGIRRRASPARPRVSCPLGAARGALVRMPSPARVMSIWSLVLPIVVVLAAGCTSPGQGQSNNQGQQQGPAQQGPQRARDPRRGRGPQRARDPRRGRGAASPALACWASVLTCRQARSAPSGSSMTQMISRKPGRRTLQLTSSCRTGW